MFDAMSLAQLTEQHVELLPARTVLSLWRAGILDGGPGESGNSGANGQSFSSTGVWEWIIGSNQTDAGTKSG
jgi:hypothetical protein